MERRHRVAVLGNSTGVLMVPPPSSVEEKTFPHVLHEELRAAGLDVEVRNECRLFELVQDGYRRFQDHVVPWSPDVLVVAYGIIELQPNVVPTRLVRHFTTPSVAGTGLSGLWNRRLKKRVWPKVRDLQRRAAPIVGMHTWRVKPSHFGAELERIARVAREQQSLVLLCDIGRPGSRLQHFFPGILDRHAAYQAEIASVVRRIGDDDVRLVPISRVPEERGEEAIPDGMHYDAKAHATIAAMLAAEVEPWLAALG